MTLVPDIPGSEEYTSKPTQHSVKELMSLGIRPDIIVTRSDGPIGEEVREKIALFCNVEPDCIIENITLPVLYQAPKMLEEQHFSDIVLRGLGLEGLPPCDLAEWDEMLRRIGAVSYTHLDVYKRQV